MLHVIGHKNPDTDSICSSIVLSYFLDGIPIRLGNINSETEFILNKFGVKMPRHLTSAKNKDVFLVDHSEHIQSIDDLKDGNLIGIIDHHKINISTSEPIIYISKPVGCTATIIAELYFKNAMELIGGKNKELKPELAGLLLSSILSDTVLFKSVTTTDLDIEISNKLANIAKIDDVQSYGMEMLTAKSLIDKMSSKEIAFMDYKDFDFKGKKVGMGQVEVINTSFIDTKIDEILNIMDEKLKMQGYEFILFVVTNIIKEGSMIFVIGNTSIFENAFNVKLIENRVYLDGVMSRKKQIVPPIEKYF